MNRNLHLSLSTSSLRSLLPRDYGQTTQDSNFNPNSNSNSNPNPTSNSILDVSDALARGSDVTVSTTTTPQAEYKGFATYVISCIVMLAWLLWSLLPDQILHSLGVHYYPSRWWALAIPSYVLVAMVYMYAWIALYGTERLTLPLCDTRNIVDDTGVVAIAEQLQTQGFTTFTGVEDLPLSLVNEVLYSEGAEW